MAKRGIRIPSRLPEWIHRRVETDIYLLNDNLRNFGGSLLSDTMVLDAGAGEGQYKPFFLHTQYFGVDLAIGDNFWDYSNLDAICNLVKLPFENHTFDVVLCTQVLEHVPEPSLVLSEIFRVLKPGGQLFLSVPQSWPQHQKPYDYYRYTSFGIRYLVEKVGFEVKKLDPMGGYFWYLSFQFQNINFWLFPKGMRNRLCTWPIRALFGLVFQLAIPLILYYLDPLDKIKDESFGYFCTAIKPCKIPPV